jgi:hypothetical protein
MKIGENTEIKIDLKTVVAIILVTTSFVGMYYTLQADIEEAKQLPSHEVKRLEYDLKEKWNEENINDLKERVNMLEQIDDVVFEEIKMLSTSLNVAAEKEDKINQLNKKLELLYKQKNNKKKRK